MTLCMLCGNPLPPKPWWKRLFGVYPQHSTEGAEGDQCWIDFNRRIGIANPGPRPDL